jgi:hypothetical protein
MWLSTGPSATGSGGVPAPIEPRMKKLASILLGTLFAACALHAGEGVSKTRLVQNLEAGKKQTLVTFGTSLTAVGAWVDQLRAVLDQQFP